MTLAHAIEQVYDAFADMPRPIYIEHDPIELKAEEEQQLVSLPLRELSPELMRSYLFDAVYTVGTWDDFCYFLPRLLELLPSQEIELEPLSYRLKYGEEQLYPLSEKQSEALHDFVLAFWNHQFEDYGWWLLMHLRWQTFEPFRVTRAELLHLWRTHPAGAGWLAFEICSTREAEHPPEWERGEVMAWLESALTQTTETNDRENLQMALDLLKDPASHSKLRPDSAEAIVESPPEQVLDWMDDILRSIRNPEWPAAQILLPFLVKVGAPLAPHLREVLNGTDGGLKITLLEHVIARSPELASELVPELQQLATLGEADKETTQLVQNILEGVQGR